MFWVIIVLINVYLTITTSRDPQLDYDISTNLFVITLTATDFILITNVQQEMRLQDQKDAITDASLADRARWAIWLVQSRRGIGWNWEPKDVFVDRFPANTPRSTFLIQQIISGFRYFILCDVASIYNRSSVAFVQPLASRPLLWRCADLAGWVIFQTNQVSLFLSILSIVLVGSGYSTPPVCVRYFFDIFPACFTPVAGLGSVVRTLGGRLHSPTILGVSQICLYRRKVQAIDCSRRVWHQLIRRVSHRNSH